VVVVDVEPSLEDEKVAARLEVRSSVFRLVMGSADASQVPCAFNHRCSEAYKRRPRRSASIEVALSLHSVCQRDRNGDAA
jgi:hypothetical protein